MILTFTNKKGGTGKTTLVVYTAELLARHGKKVLIIDLDDNCSVSEVYEKVLLPENSKQLMSGREVKPYNVRKNDVGGLIDIIPSDLDISMLSNVMDVQLKLQIRKQKFDDKYDYIIIDPPGSFDAQTRNAVFAADVIVVPGRASPLDYKATLQYIDTLESCCLDSEVFVLCNCYNKQRDTNNFWDKYVETFDDLLIREPIPLINTLQKIVANPAYPIHASVESRLNRVIEKIIDGKLEVA